LRLLGVGAIGTIDGANVAFDFSGDIEEGVLVGVEDFVAVDALKFERITGVDSGGVEAS